MNGWSSLSSGDRDIFWMPLITNDDICNRLKWKESEIRDVRKICHMWAVTISSSSGGSDIILKAQRDPNTHHAVWQWLELLCPLCVPLDHMNPLCYEYIIYGNCCYCCSCSHVSESCLVEQALFKVIVLSVGIHSFIQASYEYHDYIIYIYLIWYRLHSIYFTACHLQGIMWLNGRGANHVAAMFPPGVMSVWDVCFMP